MTYQFLVSLDFNRPSLMVSRSRRLGFLFDGVFKTLFSLTNLLILSILVAMSGSLSAQTQMITLGCEDKVDFPHVLGDGEQIDWKNPGTNIELTKRMADELGLKIEIKRFPWKRALELELKNGTIDGLFAASYKKEREEFGEFPSKEGQVDETRCMYVNSYFFYKLKTSPLDWDGKVLKNLKGAIGVPRGYSVVSDLKQMGYQIAESDDARKDFRRMNDGWLGAIAALGTAEDFLLEASPEFNQVIVKVQPPISTKAYYLMLSHQFVAKNPELSQAIWDKFRELRPKELPKIMRKYLGK